MPKLMKKRSTKVGLPPGTLVHIGEKKLEEAKITIMDYDGTHFEENDVRMVEECFPYKGKPTVTWINVEGLHQADIIQKLGDFFGVHPLVQEDILNTDQRPKMEDHGEYIYTVLKMLMYDERKREIVTEQISVVLGSNFVISFQEGIKGDVFNLVREQIRSGKGRVRIMGADYLAYLLLDSIVDSYFIILEKLGERIEEIEEELISSPSAQTSQSIHFLKREMLFLRKSVWPLREVLGSMERAQPSLIGKATWMYLRDVYDHTIHVIDTVETFRDMLSGMLDMYLSSISNRMNAVMKMLTIIATIFIPLTFIAGVYGMNFRYMPELEWRWGYPLIWAVMIVSATFMLIYFWRKKWF